MNLVYMTRGKRVRPTSKLVLYSLVALVEEPMTWPLLLVGVVEAGFLCGASQSQESLASTSRVFPMLEMVSVQILNLQRK